MTDLDMIQGDEQRTAEPDRRQTNRRDSDRMVAHMPEKEERRHWIVEYGLLGLIGLAMAGIFAVLWDLKEDNRDARLENAETKQEIALVQQSLADYIEEMDKFHDLIPPNFFTGERFTAMHGKLLTARQEAHEREFDMWKDILKDQSHKMDNMIEAVYVLTGELRTNREIKR